MAAKNVVVKGISLDPDVLTKGLERASQLGFQNSFSAYVQQLIRADIKSEEASDFKSSTAVVQSAAGGAERVVDLNKHSSPSISEKKKKKRA